MKAVSLLLAAGQGRRAGGPKAWRERQGRPLLARQLDFLISLFAPEDIFVAVQAQWLDRCKALHAGVHWISVDPEAPAMASLQALAAAALESASARATGDSSAFVHHVDMAVWDAEVFQALFSSLVRSPEFDVSEETAEAAMPVFEGKGGHPVLLKASLLGELLKLDPKAGRLDHFLRARRTKRVETAAACVLDNANEA